MLAQENWQHEKRAFRKYFSRSGSRPQPDLWWEECKKYKYTMTAIFWGNALFCFANKTRFACLTKQEQWVNRHKQLHVLCTPFDAKLHALQHGHKLPCKHENNCCFIVSLLLKYNHKLRAAQKFVVLFLYVRDQLVNYICFPYNSGCQKGFSR